MHLPVLSAGPPVATGTTMAVRRLVHEGNVSRGREAEGVKGAGGMRRGSLVRTK